MSVSFVDLRWFALLILALPMGWVMLRWCVAMAHARRWSAVVLRLGLLTSIAALLAGASSFRETNKVAVVGVIDVSDSIRRYGYVGLDEEGARYAHRAFSAALRGFTMAEAQGTYGADADATFDQIVSLLITALDSGDWPE